MPAPQDLTRHERLVMKRIAMESHDHPVRFWLVLIAFLILLSIALWFLLGLVPFNSTGPNPPLRAPLPRMEHGH